MKTTPTATRNRQLAACCAAFAVLVGLSAFTGLVTPNSARAADPAKPAETLSNASIIELHKLGLSETTLVEKIKSSKCDFDVTVSGLRQLKEAKVPDQVIQAMISATASPKTIEAKPVTTGDPNDPNSAHEHGVWLYQTIDGQGKMTKIEPVSATQTATGSGWGAAWGGTSAMRAVFSGDHAATQTTERRPVFYAYFGDQPSAFMMGATSPSEMVLAKFEIKKTKSRSERLLITGKIRGYGGSEIGIDPKARVLFEPTKIAPGIYKLVPKDDLPVGEYCFCGGGMGGAHGQVFGFGISAK